MEKQRKYAKSESGRRLLKKIVKEIVFALVFMSVSQSLFCQSLTNALIRELRISPVPEQALVVNSDIKFEVIIPYTTPGQIEVSMPQEPENVQIKTLRKVEAAGNGGSTKIELWISFAKTGMYFFSPLEVKIKNSRKQIAFMPVRIGINPKEQEPVCVILTDSGMNKNISLAAGQTVKFRLCLKYAVQLVQFSWELPKDSIFVQGKTYEFTEIKQREKIVSDDLIPVSDFEWTPLVTGVMDFPEFHIQAIAYNGDKVTVKLPSIKINVVKSRGKNSGKENSYFLQAFEADSADGVEAQVEVISGQDAEILAKLRSKERHSLFGKARKERIEYEKKLSLPYTQNEFKIVWIFIYSFIACAIAALMIFLGHKKRSDLNIFLSVILICLFVLVIYSVVCGAKKYGISKGTQLCSIPEASASIKSELPAGNRIQILEKSGEWYLIRFGESEGWCSKDSIIILK